MAVVAAPRTYKISVKQSPSLSLSIKDGRVVLLKKNDADFSQLWVQTNRTEKDAEGRPTFILVNRLTGQALRSPDNLDTNVSLETCNDSKAPHVNNDILWTEHTKSDDYYFIATREHSDRVIDAASALEGVEIILYSQNIPPLNFVNQKWQLIPTFVNFGGEFAGTTQHF